MVDCMDRNWLRKIGYDEDEIDLLAEILSGPAQPKPEEQLKLPEPVWSSATLHSAPAC